jgi:hypothetical protein
MADKPLMAKRPPMKRPLTMNREGEIFARCPE